MDKKVLLVLAIGIPLLILQFFFFQGLKENELQESADDFISGYDKGVEDSVLSIYHETEDCNIVPIFIENNTRNLIDFSCITGNPNPP